MHKNLLNRVLTILIMACCHSTGHADSNSFLFPAKQISVGYYNNSFIRTSFPAPPKPLFWKSSYYATSGIMLSYLKSIYHTKKYFSILFGLSLSNWNIHTSHLAAFSGFFEFRWWLLHVNGFNPYLLYSIAGPTVLSNNHIGQSNLGGYVLFQDYVGAGILFGKEHRVNLEVKLVHYSNGDLAEYNQGLQVPFLIALSYSI